MDSWVHVHSDGTLLEERYTDSEAGPVGTLVPEWVVSVARTYG